MERKLNNDFFLFTDFIVRESFEAFQGGDYVKQVCDFLQHNQKTVRIGPKDHFKCLPKGSKILMASGDELEIEKLSEGDFVKTREGSGRISRIEDTGIKDCMEICAEGGIKIECSPDHQILTERGFVEAKEITAGERIAQMAELDFEGHKTLSDDEIVLLAFLTADGSLSAGTRFTKMDEEIRETILSICERMKFDVHQEREGTFYISGAAEWLRSLGLYHVNSRRKTISAAVMSSPKYQAKKFLEMLWSCDGSVSIKHLDKSLGILYSTTSEEMARQIKLLLLRFGVQSHISKCSQIYKGEKYFFFQLTIAGADSSIKFAENFRLNSSRKNENLKIVLKEAKRRTEIQYSKCAPIRNGIRWIKVRSIKKIGERECFDFEVEREHNYVVNSIVVHNSTSLYAFLMWKIWKSRLEGGFGCFYFSYDKSLSFYHLSKLKMLIKSNPYFEDLVDYKATAEGLLKFAWEGTHEFCTIKPKGLLSFKRGIHEKIILVDDPFQDPANMLDPVIVKKINEIFKSQIIDMPLLNGNLHVVMTPQTNDDFCFDKALMERVNVLSQPAEFLDEKNIRRARWPEHMPLTELEIRRRERGEKVYMKEYMCQPSFSSDSFWQREVVGRMLDTSLFQMQELKTDNIVTAGWDVGKFRHPAHINFFERVGDIWFQRYQEFMDGWDYSAQVEHVNDLTKRLQVDYGFFDATGREIESFRERKILNPIWQPVIFKTETKWRMVNNMEGLRERGRLKLIPHARQINQLLVVNNSLDAMETIEGHGEPFFSMAMALLAEFEIGKSPVKSIGIIPRQKVSPFGRHVNR